MDNDKQIQILKFSVSYYYGQLSSLIHLHRLSPLIPEEMRFVKKVAVGESHCIMLMGNGSLWGVGSNEFGQLGIPIKQAENGKTIDNSIIEQMREIELANFNLKKLSIGDKKNQEVLEIVCGKQHTVIVVGYKDILSGKLSGRKIYAFGHEAGVGINEQDSTHVPSLIKIQKLGESNDDLKFVYAKYNTNIAVDIRGRMFMWGENSNNMKLRKPKLFYTFPQKGIQIEQVELGRRHGVVRTNEPFGCIYGWGDGTYGELGVMDNLPIEKPTKMTYFESRRIQKVQTGARHTLVLDHEGNIFAMGDNSEDQCAISGRRANEPELILKDFKVTDIYAGDSHNVALSDEGGIYNWGGTVINSAWAQKNANESKLKPMEDLKRKKIGIITLGYSNTVIISGQNAQGTGDESIKSGAGDYSKRALLL